MRGILLFLGLTLLLSTAGCTSDGGSQSTFHHNNREHQKWVNNPSSTPKYKNPATGGPLFY